MKTNIGIPSPCSEDWKKMQPTDRGAYCGKCQIDVIDFSAKQPEEIREILEQRSGQKTCAHISNVQMDMVNTNYHLWNNQPLSIFRSKFLYACMLAFGFTLFTGCESPFGGDVVGELVEDHDVGMVAEDTTTYYGDGMDADTGQVLIDGLMEEILPLEEGFTLSTEMKGQITGH
ncbi:MAG: hypothetical protein ACI8ZM_005717 [Crocinitomix sp.]|jgi:hypothetical protein